jgi:hypothetical protein
MQVTKEDLVRWVRRSLPSEIAGRAPRQPRPPVGRKASVWDRDFGVGAAAFVANLRVSQEEYQSYQTKNIETLQKSAESNLSQYATVSQKYLLPQRGNAFIDDARERLLPNSFQFSAYNVIGFELNPGSTNPFLEQAQELNWMYIVAIVIGFGAAAGIFAAFLVDLPSLDGLEEYQPSIATTLYTDQDEPFHSFYEQRRMLVSLDKIPAHLKQAVLSVEDAQFYEHQGLSARGIARALLMNLLSRRKAQGGSTITQQLARGLFLTPEKNISRKVKEALLSVEIERHYSKEKILELYFNSIEWGKGVYGIGAASQFYFKHSARDLTVAESAMLVIQLASPGRYSPTGTRAGRSRSAARSTSTGMAGMSGCGSNTVLVTMSPRPKV